MIAEVVKTTEGTFQLKNLAGGAASGLPVGSILAIHSSRVPAGFLPCNGSTFDSSQYPALYITLGSNKLPDLREAALVGVGVRDEGVEQHDVYELGEFKDDQIGSCNVALQVTGGSNTSPVTNASTGVTNARTGATTHGKQYGVNYIIKAVSGVLEIEEDEIYGQLVEIIETSMAQIDANVTCCFNELKDQLDASIANLTPVVCCSLKSGELMCNVSMVGNQMVVTDNNCIVNYFSCSEGHIGIRSSCLNGINFNGILSTVISSGQSPYVSSCIVTSCCGCTYMYASSGVPPYNIYSSSVSVACSIASIVANCCCCSVGRECTAYSFLPTGVITTSNDNCKYSSGNYHTCYIAVGCCCCCFYPLVFHNTCDDRGSPIVDAYINSIGGGSSCDFNNNFIHFTARASGWSDERFFLDIKEYTKYTASEVTIGAIGGGTTNNQETVVWLRGGLTYRVTANTRFALYTTSYTSNCSTFTYGTSYCGGSNVCTCIYWSPNTITQEFANYSTTTYIGTTNAGCTPLNTNTACVCDVFCITGSSMGNSIAIGKNAIACIACSVAIGANASAGAYGAVAIGNTATATSNGEVILRACASANNWLQLSMKPKELQVLSKCSLSCNYCGVSGYIRVEPTSYSTGRYDYFLTGRKLFGQYECIAIVPMMCNSSGCLCNYYWCGGLCWHHSASTVNSCPTTCNPLYNLNGYPSYIITGACIVSNGGCKHVSGSTILYASLNAGVNNVDYGHGFMPMWNSSNCFVLKKEYDTFLNQCSKSYLIISWVPA